MIEEYNFGHIKIDGKEYTKDVEVRWTGEVLEWDRPESHLIDVENLERTVEAGPQTIVIGTGDAGIASLTEEAIIFIESKGIELIVDKTAEAVRTYNVLCEDSPEEEGKQRKVIGLFHLTC
jgi:hypothetical protein